MQQNQQNNTATPQEMRFAYLVLGAAGRSPMWTTPAVTANGVCLALPRHIA